MEFQGEFLANLPDFALTGIQGGQAFPSLLAYLTAKPDYLFPRCYHCRCVFDEPNDIGNFFKEAERFCNNYNQDPYIRADRLIRELSTSFERHHQLVRTESVAPGAWRGLGGFIRSFAMTSGKGPGELRRIACSFFHDRGFLEVYYTARNMSEKASAAVGEVHISCEDIQKIVLDSPLSGSLQTRRRP